MRRPRWCVLASTPNDRGDRVTVRVAPVEARTVPEAIGLSVAATERARAGDIVLVGSVVRGPAVALGARQRAQAVVTGDVATWHRATTGTAVYVGDVAYWWTLALPRVDALRPDATLATLVNRNVRGFLRGFTRAGVPAAWFGREWIATRGDPAAIVGYDVDDAGVVTLDVVAGWSDPVAVPAQHAATLERAVDRWRGHTPVAWRGIVPGEDHAARVQRVMDVVCDGAAEPVALAPAAYVAPPAVTAECASVVVPIGHVEAARVGEGAWLGGDALVSTAWLARAESALARGRVLPDGAVVDGARPDDWRVAWSALPSR